MMLIAFNRPPVEVIFKQMIRSKIDQIHSKPLKRIIEDGFRVRMTDSDRSR